MSLRVPRGQVVSPRRRGYAGNRVPGQAFFWNFLGLPDTENSIVGGCQMLIFGGSRGLIVRRIIRAKLGRRSEHLVALDKGAAMSAWHGLVSIRVRCDNPGATRWQTINQSPIRCDSNHPNADRTLSSSRRRSNTLLLAACTRLTISGRLRNLGALRGRRSFAPSGIFRNHIRGSGRQRVGRWGNLGLSVWDLILFKTGRRSLG